MQGEVGLDIRQHPLVRGSILIAEERDNLDRDLNPPAPETFFVSDFHNSINCCSHGTPEKG